MVGIGGSGGGCFLSLVGRKWTLRLVDCTLRHSEVFMLLSCISGSSYLPSR